MKLLLHRDFDNGKDTLGRLYYRDQYYQDLKYVYTLEDEYRKDKVKGETRIPGDRFSDVIARKGGKIYEAFSKSSIEEIRSFTQKYGVLEIMAVPNFENILFHVGNKDTDSNGCILIGDMANNSSSISGFISASMTAYSRLVGTVGFYLDKGESIRLEIIDYDREVQKLI